MRISGTLAFILAASAFVSPGVAAAQTVGHAGDVVVMRRVVAPPTVDRDANGYDQNQFHWETGAWTAPASCDPTLRQTRTVTCVRHRTAQADAACAGAARPADQQTVPNPTTCTSGWVYTDWSADQSV